jgi:hypothetical protein
MIILSYSYSYFFFIDLGISCIVSKLPDLQNEERRASKKLLSIQL